MALQFQSFRSVFLFNALKPIIFAAASLASSFTDAHLAIAQPPPSAKPIKKCWELPGSPIPEAGIAADKTQGYFVDAKGRLVAVDLKTGAIGWVAEFGGKPISQVVLTASSVVVASRSDGTDGAAQLVILGSFSKETGLPNWRITLPTSVRYFLQPVETGLVSVADNGEIRLLSEIDGRSIWTASAGSQLVSDPQFAAGRLQLGAGPKRLQEYSLTDGKLKWAAVVKSTPTRLAIPGGSGSIYIEENGAVFSVAENGELRWKFRAGGRVIFQTVIGDDLLLGSSDNFVYYMSTAGGNLIWKRRLPGRVASGGIVGESRAVFTVVGDPTAFVVDLEDGRIVDKISLEGADNAFLLTPIRANGIYLLAATVKGLAAFSSDCGNEKSGDGSPLP